jgi:hypothetical protein
MSFCGEHGTTDYCPDCLSESLDSEIAKLKAERDQLAAALRHLFEVADYHQGSGWFTDYPECVEAMEIAAAALATPSLVETRPVEAQEPK